MKKYQKEILKITAGEVLSSLFDLAAPFFEASPLYRKPIKKYLKQLQIEKKQFFNKLNYFKKMGYIKTFVENKEKFLELTPKGFDYLKKFSFDNITIKRPKKWDGKWRIIIFDIKEKLKNNRDTLRWKLLQLGFYQIQKSVYVYSFECTNEITLLTKHLLIADSVLIMIADIIQGEEKIIKFFLDKNILTNSDLAKHIRKQSKKTLKI